MLPSGFNCRRSALAPLFRFAARFGRFQDFAVRVVTRLEGGPMWSATFRELMQAHYDVTIGPYSYGGTFGPGGLPEGTRIGNYCSLATGIIGFRRNHPSSRISQHPFFFNAAAGLLSDDTIHAIRDQPLVIDHDVWIGANVIITPRCKVIGLGAVVGAGAVVTKDVPPFAIVVGNPARQIGERFPAEIQKVLMESRWWEHPVDRLVPVMELFQGDATLENAQRLREHLLASNPGR